MADVTDPTDAIEPDRTAERTAERTAGGDLGSTTLPAASAKPRRARVFILVGAGILVVVIVLGLVLRGHNATTGGASGASSAGGRTGAPVIADSASQLSDSASVQRDVASLLRHALPSSGPRFPSAAAAPAQDVLLAPSLRLDDPALPACAAEIEDGGALLGIDRVTYQGEPSLLIVTTGDSDDQAIAWVVGPRCAEPGAGGIRTIVTTVR